MSERRLHARALLCGESPPAVVSSRAFDKFFNFTPSRLDPNGAVDKEVGYFFCSGGGVDGVYSFNSGDFGRVPEDTPIVLPTRVGLVPPYSVSPSPWPLNHIPKLEGARGGGYVGRKVYLDGLRIQGRIMCGHPDLFTSNQSWDNVRFVVVFDSKPVTNSNGGYTQVGTDLFLNDAAGGGAALQSGTAQYFSPTGFARYRVLFDKVYHVERDVYPDLSTVSAAAVTVNPDNVQEDLFRFDNKTTLAATLANATPTLLLPVGTAPGALAITSAGVTIPAIVSYDQQARTDVARVGTIVDSQGAAFRIAAHNVEPSAFNPHGRDGLPIDEFVSLQGLWTLFDQAGMITSGAVWLFAVSDNGCALVGGQDVVPGAAPNSFISTVVTYVGD